MSNLVEIYYNKNIINFNTILPGALLKIESIKECYGYLSEDRISPGDTVRVIRLRKCGAFTRKQATCSDCISNCYVIDFQLENDPEPRKDWHKSCYFNLCGLDGEKINYE